MVEILKNQCTGKTNAIHHPWLVNSSSKMQAMETDSATSRVPDMKTDAGQSSTQANLTNNKCSSRGAKEKPDNNLNSLEVTSG
jgi:hypothetical protein